MKKLMLFIITGIIVFSFNGCETNNYIQFNEKLESIEVEESGYIFFTSDKIIDEEDEYDLMIILKAVFEENEIHYDFFNYSYYIAGDILYAIIGYSWDDDENFMQAIIMYDFIKQETIHFELLTPSSSINNSNYVIGNDEWQNMWVYSQQNQNFVVYINTGNVITQTNIARDKVDDSISYMVDQGMFIRYIVEDEIFTFIDAYDYINLEEKIISINPNIISEDSQKTIFFNNNMYNVSINDMLSIKDKDNKVYFETTIMTLYESSNLGIQANKILIDLDQENDPNQFGFSLVNNEIYLYYKYNLGFLFNKSLLGISPYLIFRFDFETNSLKYIGLNDDIYYVYKK